MCNKHILIAESDMTRILIVEIIKKRILIVEITIKISLLPREAARAGRGWESENILKVKPGVICQQESATTGAGLIVEPVSCVMEKGPVYELLLEACDGDLRTL